MKQAVKSIPEEANSVLKFWFEEITPEQWWRSKDLDSTIGERFSSILKQLEKHVPQQWLETAKGSLAAIIVLDQFPRNIYRNHAKSFATDHIALEVSRTALLKEFNRELNEDENIFLYIPFQHSEDLDDQNYSVELYRKSGTESSYKSAMLHRDIIKRFGRFPHRNEHLGRVTTAEEQEFLSQGALFW